MILSSEELASQAEQLKDVIDFYNQTSEVPIESLVFHGERDQLSNWLRARGEFEVANTIKPRKVSEFTKTELRDFLLESIKEEKDEG